MTVVRYLYLFMSIVISILGISTFSAGYTDDGGVEPGDIVDLDYIGTFQNGTEFDSGNMRDARMDLGQFIDGFYDGVLGMKIGEPKTITVLPEKGYTDPNSIFYGETLIFVVTINLIVQNVRDDETYSSISSVDSFVKSNQTTNSSTSQSSTHTPRLELPIYLSEVLFSLSLLILVKKINLSKMYENKK